MTPGKKKGFDIGRITPGKEKGFDIGKITRVLAPAQNTICAATTIAEHYKDDPKTLATVKAYLHSLGINVYQPSENITIVCWNDDLEEVLTADLRMLPEFLSSEDRVLRKLAKWRLDTLTGEKEDGM